MARPDWTKEKVLDTIRSLHAHGSNTLSYRYVKSHNSRLHYYGIKWFGGWRQALTAAGYPPKSNYRRWSRQKILLEVKRQHDKGLPLTTGAVCRRDGGLYFASKVYFGKDGWNRVLEILKISLPPKSNPVWNHKKILNGIRKFYQKVGRLDSAFVQGCNWRLANAARKYFGSWGKAVTAAGFDYSKIRRRGGKVVIWTQEKIIDRILEIYRTERQVNYQFVFDRWPIVCVSARKKFGTYRAAVEAAGLDYSKIRKREPTRSWSRVKIVAEIKRYHDEDLSLCYSDVHAADQGLIAAAERYLGSWHQALRIAGFDPKKFDKRLVWSKTNILEEIRGLSKIGLPLNQTFVRKNRPDLFKASWVYWSGWAEAVHAAGFDYKKIRLVCRNYWSKRKVLQEIRKLDRAKVRLNTKVIKKNYGGLFATAWVLFGSWDQAVEAAGINYMDHCTVWSTRAWLRKLTKADVTKLKRRADVLNRLSRKHKYKRRSK